MSRLTILFGAYAVCIAALNAQALISMVSLASGNPTMSHVVGIPFVVAALFYVSRESIFAAPRPAPAIGACIIVLGLALSIGSRLAPGESPDLLSVAIGGAVLSWIGGFVLFYGLDASRAALFPLLFLAFMIPMPSVIINGATRFLKAGSADVVASLFSLTGTPFHRQGFVFSLPTAVIEIADECSGIRSSIGLLLTSLLAGYSFLTKTWTKTILVLAIVPAALLKNAIRIVALSLLAMHVDPSFLTGQLHHEGGIVFFVIALCLLVPIFALLRRFERTRSDRSVIAEL